MARVLIHFAHPALEKSRVQKAFSKKVRKMEGITFNDLYERYPDFDIDVEREQYLLDNHDVIIFQHPLYWYSSPAIIKQWQDLVLQHNWAYGSGGHHLDDKIMFNAISCGGSREAYSALGRNRFTIKELLRPFEQTAMLCRMQYYSPFVVFGTHKLNETEIEEQAGKYAGLVAAIAGDQLDAAVLKSAEYMNDIETLKMIP